ncbi:MAG: TIR domain-containing protein [Oscillospiraceae bacterium]|nr:TIR domain-containing protein [Oscillospiraceae bacterium]
MDDIDIQRIPERFLGLGQIAFLANGSVGKVYCINDIFSQRQYALKVIDCGCNMSKFQNALYEIDIMTRLADLAGVVRILDSEIVEDGDSRTVYILEAYHVPFYDYLKDNHLSVMDKVDMLMELCSTLIKCRDAGVLHLDLQLRNLFADAAGKILLGDFSSALLTRDLGKNKAMRGTLAYMAPEVYRNGWCSERSEIYAVGMLLHHLVAPELFPSIRWVGDELSTYKRLAGAPLYGEAKENDALCEAVKRIMGHICAFDVEDRPKSFEQLREILGGLYEMVMEDRRFRSVVDQTILRRRLNVVYVVQISGAMIGEPIREINRIGQETLHMLQKMQAEHPEVEIRTSVLTFGGAAAWQRISAKLDAIPAWPDLKAGGMTCLSGALRELNKKLSRFELLSECNYNYLPVVIFMTNGYSPDSYESELEGLVQNPWFRNAIKVAIPVGNEHNDSVVEKLIGTSEAILRKDDLSLFPELIRLVSVCASVCQSRSVSPIIQDADPIATSAVVSTVPSLIIQDADSIGITCVLKPSGDPEPSWAEPGSDTPAKQDDTVELIEALRKALAEAPSILVDSDGKIVLPDTENKTVPVINTDSCIGVPELRFAGGAGFAICRVCGEAVDPSASYCPHCGSKQNIEKPAVDIRKVQFSATAPKTFIKDEYSVIDVYMYEEAFRSVVEEAKLNSDVPMQEKKGRAMSVETNSAVRVVLFSPDVEIDDNDQEATWDGGYLTFSFPVFVPKCYPKRQMLFTASVYINQIIATKLTFTVKCSSIFEQKIEISRKDYLSAFISYASQDRRKVAAIIQGMKKARPEMDIFFDVDSLRSGEDWEEVLQREIDSRDILYLCWSRAARDSVWVDREWRYAYRQKGEECIDPVAIDPPDLCPPPKELSKKHFNDRLLNYINTDTRRPVDIDIWGDSW